MRTNIFKFLLAVVVMMAGAHALNAQNEEYPFSGKQYLSDANYFRASGYGISPNMTMAKKQAVDAAKNMISGMISTTIEDVMETYSIQEDNNTDSDFKAVYTDKSRSVTSQVLKNINIIAEQPVQKGKNVGYWVVVEISKDSYVEKFEKEMSEGISCDFDYEKFKLILDEEMKKLE